MSCSSRESERFARLITVENGKSLADSRGEVAYAAEFFRWYAEEAVRNIGEISRAPSSGARILVQHKPAGVAVLGHAVEFPGGDGDAQDRPGARRRLHDRPQARLGDAAHRARPGAGLRGGRRAGGRRQRPAVAPLGRGGRRDAQDPRVRVVSFTGSTEVGRKLLHAAADNVVRPVMELGGNAPFIVFDDADIDAAVEGAMIAKMRNMGEACTAANRFYVHAGVHDAFAAKFAERMRALKVGNGLEDGVAARAARQCRGARQGRRAGRRCRRQGREGR